MTAPTTQLEPLLIDAEQAAALCGVGRTLWLQMNQDGRAPRPVKLGRRSLWCVEELRAWTAAHCPPRKQWNWQAGE